tara:strand:- start:7469 stop:8080 length:612 start_codon:yes stop_codon:yes gene_type:complete
MDILPALNFDAIAENTGMVEEDDVGEFVPCHFSDDEEEEEHGEGCKCALCQYGDGGSGEAHAVISRMQEIDSQMVGKVADREIYNLQADLYRTHVKEPLERQGIEAPDVTAETCRAHFSKHRMNMKRMVGSEINFVNSMQKHVRREQILSRNNVTGRTKVDNAAIKQWIALSKHKLDLIKYYKGPLSKEIASKTQNIKPYSFS